MARKNVPACSPSDMSFIESPASTCSQWLARLSIPQGKHTFVGCPSLRLIQGLNGRPQAEQIGCSEPPWAVCCVFVFMDSLSLIRDVRLLRVADFQANGSSDLCRRFQRQSLLAGAYLRPKPFRDSCLSSQPCVTPSKINAAVEYGFNERVLDRARRPRHRSQAALWCVCFHVGV